MNYKKIQFTHKLSSNEFGTPSGEPKRTFRTINGLADMLSTPPVRAIFAAPSIISCAPLTTDWNPEPHKRFTPKAGRSIGTPHNRDVCRGI